jgi:hypothetical protein
LTELEAELYIFTFIDTGAFHLHLHLMDISGRDFVTGLPAHRTLELNESPITTWVVERWDDESIWRSTEEGMDWVLNTGDIGNFTFGPLFVDTLGHRLKACTPDEGRVLGWNLP